MFKTPRKVSKRSFTSPPKDSYLPNIPIWNGELQKNELIGFGSFSKVYSTDEGVVLKETPFSSTRDMGIDGIKRMRRSQILEELQWYGTKGCIPGVFFQKDGKTDKNVLISILPRCNPVQWNEEKLNELFHLIDVLDEKLIYDLKPDNVMMLETGSILPVWNGKLSFKTYDGPTTMILVDLNILDDVDDADPRWSPLNKGKDIKTFKKNVFQEWFSNPNQNMNEFCRRLEME